MAMASPTPLGGNIDGVLRRPLPRSLKQLRPHLRRGSPLSTMALAGEDPLPHSWKFSTGDSSDDEVPVPPMKFSAEAKAILGDEASVIERSPPSQRNSAGDAVSQLDSDLREHRSPLPVRQVFKDRTSLPSLKRSESPRVVHLSPTGVATLRKPASVLIDKGLTKSRDSEDLITPAPRQRYELERGSYAFKDSDLDHDAPPTTDPSSGAEPVKVSREHADSLREVALHIGNLSIDRKKADEIGAQGSLRVKRVGKVTGRYLSGPARRGMKRRQSDEDQSPIPEDPVSSGGTLEAHSRNMEDPVDRQTRPPSPRVEYLDEAKTKPPSGADSSDIRPQSRVSLITGSPRNIDEKRSRIAALHVAQPKKETAPGLIPERPSEKSFQPSFKVPPLPLLPSRFDQENEPPPTFKRNKSHGLALSERPFKLVVKPDEKMLIETPATVSPPRQPLALRSHNTPHRQAPPPLK